MVDNYEYTIACSSDFGSWYIPRQCCIDKISVCGSKYEVSLLLERIDANISYLNLQTSRNESFWYLNLQTSRNAKLKINLHIRLTYKNEIKEFSVDFQTNHYSLYRLRKVKTTDLCKITCILRVQEAIQSVEGENTDNDEQEAGSSHITHEGGNINSEVNEAKKSKGLVGLSENLKDVLMSEEDSDVILKVGEQNYPAHKVIIKARSSVFKAMLNHEMREKNEGVISIPDCDPGIFRDFLFYIYTGKIDDISKENVFELHRISDKYDVKDLKTECVDFLLKNLSVNIICDVISLATRHCEQALLSRAIEFFTDHAQDILTSVNWQNFVKEYPVEANELFLKTFNKVSGK